MKHPLIALTIIFIVLVAFTGELHAKKRRRSKATAISKTTIEMIASGDLAGALKTLGGKRKNAKANHLHRQISRIIAFDTYGYKDKLTAHVDYLNLGIAYHNLYLFLKWKGEDNPKYAESALEYYKKARKRGTSLHKAECNILQAAILASSGDTKGSDKKFKKVKEAIATGDFEATEYLATYYAATSDVEQAVRTLGELFELDPKRTMKWVKTGDDFHTIENDPRFKSLVAAYKNRSSGIDISLRAPEVPKPCLKVIDSTGLFKRQKSLPRKRRMRKR